MGSKLHRPTTVGKIKKLASQLSVFQGTGEQRSEMYKKYFEGAAQLVTRKYARNSSRVPGSAGQQATMVRGQDGLASIVVVTILTVIITLISLGFARLMDRAVVNSENRQASNVATYAAQSAINDVATYIKTNTTAYSSNCVGNSSLIGSSSSPGPFYNDANLSNTSNRSIQYSCLLLNQTPNDLVYQQLPSNSSRLVKMTTSAWPGSLDKIMFSWQPSNSQITGYPSSTPTLSDETTWNSPANNYIPMLRATLYPIPSGDSISGVQANSKTVFLYPQPASGTVPAISYTGLADGSLVPVPCTTTVAAASFNGTADYTCNVIINNLSLAAQPSAVDFFYVRLMPIYNSADVKIKANDMWGQSVNFVHVQAVVDVTARSDSVAKRLQARVGIGSVGTGAPDDNLSPTDNLAPEYTVRSANAICKRLLEFNSYYSYAQVDGPSKICNQLSTTVYTPAPTLTLSINGVDSATPTPGGGYNGISYIGAGGSATVRWVSTDSAYNCNASGGWNGDKNPASSWSGSTGTGTQNFNGITNVTNYSLQCNGPGGATPTKTVTAWPPPTASVSGPGSVHAGDSFTLSWSSNNAIYCDLSGSWTNNGRVGTSGNETIYTAWNDHSTRSYTATCYDPSSRSGSDTWTLGTSGSSSALEPPTCTASANFSGSTTNDATITWSTNCPQSDPPNAGYPDRYIWTNVPGIPNGYVSTWWYGSSPPGGVRITQGGTYNFRIVVWAPGWGDQNSPQADSGTKTATFYPPLQITSFFNAGVWDQGPECNFPNPKNPYHQYDKTWWCRNGRLPTTPPNTNPGCADGVHRWTTCNVHWSTSGGYGTIQCTMTVIGYGSIGSSWPGPSAGSKDTGQLGWLNGGGVTNYMYLNCSDSAGQTANAGPI